MVVARSESVRDVGEVSEVIELCAVVMGSDAFGDVLWRMELGASEQCGQAVDTTTNSKRWVGGRQRGGLRKCCQSQWSQPQQGNNATAHNALVFYPHHQCFARPDVFFTFFFFSFLLILVFLFSACAAFVTFLAALRSARTAARRASSVNG